MNLSTRIQLAQAQVCICGELLPESHCNCLTCPCSWNSVLCGETTAVVATTSNPRWDENTYTLDRSRHFPDAIRSTQVDHQTHPRLYCSVQWRSFGLIVAPRSRGTQSLRSELPVPFISDRLRSTLLSFIGHDPIYPLAFPVRRGQMRGSHTANPPRQLPALVIHLPPLAFPGGDACPNSSGDLWAPTMHTLPSIGSTSWHDECPFSWAATRDLTPRCRTLLRVQAVSPTINRVFPFGGR